MELDKQKYDEYVNKNIRPIIEKHDLCSTKIKSIFSDRKKIIKEEIYSELLKFFGDFEFKENQSLPFRYLHGSKILPDFDEFATEDRIKGTFNDTKIDLSEVLLVKYHDGRRVSAYKGILIVLDVCNSDLKLRGPFKGVTSLVADHKKHLQYIKDKFDGFTRLEPQKKELEERFEVFTNNSSEANKLMCHNFLESFVKLSDYINSLENQITHIDDKLEILYESIRRKKDTFTPQHIGNEMRRLWWEQEELIEIEASKHPEIYKENPTQGTSEVESLNNDIACSFYDDKVLLSIPHTHDLFEPNPIHQTPIKDEDIELIYNLMSTVCEITKTICENKSKEG